MPDEMTYHNGYHHVRDRDHHGDHHDSVLLGQHLGTVGSAGRDVDDAGRDLSSAIGNAGRDLAGTIGDADRDLTSAIADADRGGRILAAIREEGGRDRDRCDRGHGDTKDSVHHLGHRLGDRLCDIGDKVREEGSRGRERTGREGDRTREAVRDTGRELLKEALKAHASDMLEHRDTQLLIERKFSKLQDDAAEARREIERIARKEAVVTRELIVSESRACMERELAKCREEALLLKMQMACGSNGNGTGNPHD